MTDIFKCRKSGTKCCAPKSSIREAMDHENEKVGQDSTMQDNTSLASATPALTVTEFSSAGKAAPVS